jgi:hypothetical protein
LKVSFTQLELEAAVKEAGRAGAQEALKAMAKQDGTRQ